MELTVPLSDVIWTLVVLMATDIITGVMVAGINGNLSSKVSYKGMAKKVGTLIAIGVCHALARVYNLGVPIGHLTAGFFVFTESISILENLLKMGVQLPKKLLPMFRSVSQGLDNGLSTDGAGEAPKDTPPDTPQ
jgi:toxin secretion/phage lysis holin